MLARLRNHLASLYRIRTVDEGIRCTSVYCGFRTEESIVGRLPAMDLILYGGLMAILALFPLLILMVLTGLRMHVVHEDERWIMYRLGRFWRIAGPGMVWVAHRWEKIERTVDVRNQPHDIEIKNLFFFDIPFGYTLNLWYRLDPEAAANGDRTLLHQIARMPMEEINEQINLAIRNLMEMYLVQMPRRYNFSGPPSLIEKLLPLLPGQDGYGWLLTQLQSDLPDALRPFGVVVHTERPILLKSLYLSAEVVKLFNRARTVQVLREQQPTLPEDTLMHLVTAFEETPLQSVRKFTIENGRLYLDGVEYGGTEEKIQMVAEQYQHRNIPQERKRSRSTTSNLPA